jgi:nucleotide-binding universal stress UspA family protein
LTEQEAKSKSPGQTKQDSNRGEGGFARQLGFISALAIGLGTMLGAGLFVLAPQAAEEAGPGATLTFILAGLIVLPTAMVVSELATAMPQEGGSYHLISRTVGPLAAAIVGPANWLGLTFATGFYLIGFTRFFAAVWDIPDFIVIIVIGAAFTVLNYRGAQATGMAQNIIVAAVVVILVLFIARGFFAVESQLHSPFIPEGWGAEMIVFQREQNGDSQEKQREQQIVHEVIGDQQDRVEIRSLQHDPNEDDVLDEISADCDLIVVGSPENWSISDWVFGKLSDKIARKAKCPVLIVHLGQGGEKEDKKD